MAPTPTLRRDPGHSPRDSGERPRSPAPDVPRMRVLSVLSSSAPLGSGLVQARFELAVRLAGQRADTTFVVDDAHPVGADAAVRLGRERGLTVLVSPGIPSADAPDSFPADLASLIRRNEWDVVETSGAAHVATHDLLLRVLGDRVLVYTPGLAPGWNDGWNAATADRALGVHTAMVRRADAVVALSPWEVPILQRDAPGRNHAHLLPLGHDFAASKPSPSRRKLQLGFVGDPTNPHDAFGWALRTFEVLQDRWSTLELLVPCPSTTAARDQIAALIPEPVRQACLLRVEGGPDTVAAEARGVLVGGDLPRHGTAILAALAAGTPVFVTDGDPVRSLFTGHAGVAFCPGHDPEASAGVVAASLDRGGSAAVDEVIAHRDRLRSRFDWDVRALRWWEVLASAWFTRHYIDHPFRGPVATPPVAYTYA